MFLHSVHMLIMFSVGVCNLSQVVVTGYEWFCESIDIRFLCILQIQTLKERSTSNLNDIFPPDSTYLGDFTVFQT